MMEAQVMWREANPLAKTAGRVLAFLGIHRLFVKEKSLKKTFAHCLVLRIHYGVIVLTEMTGMSAYSK